MDIGVRLTRDDFAYDIHSLVKAFYPDDDVTVFTDGDTCKSEAARDLLLCVTIPDYTDRKAAKDALKQSLYRDLCARCGKTLPWGTLTGIRPTKISSQMLKEGRSDEEIRAYLKETYLVSDEKIDLALRVSKNERDLLAEGDVPFDPVNVYLHVPFCPSICLYCTFSASAADAWAKKMPLYVETLIREMKTREEKLRPEGRLTRPHTVYIGGGTPTALPPDLLDALLTAVEETYDLSCASEFTVEAGRPDSITEEKLAVLRAHSVTRISINPQTMNQVTLDRIGRRHTVEDVERAFYLARSMGFDNINMDMILGLPGEDIPEVAETLGAIRALDPDSLTIHSLAVKRASRLKRNLREQKEAHLAEDEKYWGGLSFHNSKEIISLAYAAAEEMGMEPYYLYRQKNMKGGLENTGFARPGKACLYNILIMEDLEEIRAFGAGASTKTVTPDGRVERQISPKDVKTYLTRMAEESSD